MSKCIYVAAPWTARKDAKAFAKTLVDFGYTITHNWWDYEGENQDTESHEFLCRCAMQDMNGVAKADVVVVLNSAKSEGKAVEQGLAIAFNKPIIIIGELGSVSSNVFHYLPCYTWVADYEDALDKLKELR